MDLHLRRREAQRLRHVGLRPGRRLRRRPQLRRARPHRGGAVHRLHRGVGEERQLVDGLEPPRRAGQRLVELPLAARGLLDRRLGEELREQGRVERAVRPGLEGDVERLAPLDRRPGRVGDDGDAARDLHDLAHPGHRLRLRGAEALHPAADHRRTGDDREPHPRDADVDPEPRRPANLLRRVEARDLLADEPPLVRVLEGWILRDLLPGGRGGELAVRELHSGARGRRSPARPGRSRAPPSTSAPRPRRASRARSRRSSGAGRRACGRCSSRRSPSPRTSSRRRRPGPPGCSSSRPRAPRRRGPPSR